MSYLCPMRLLGDQFARGRKCERVTGPRNHSLFLFELFPEKQQCSLQGLP